MKFIARLLAAVALTGAFSFGPNVGMARAAGEVVGCYGGASSGWKFNKRQLPSGLTDSWYSGNALCTASSTNYIVDKRSTVCPSGSSERRYVANNAYYANGMWTYGWPEAITVLRWQTNLPNDLDMSFSFSQYKQTATTLSAQARYGDWNAGGEIGVETGYENAATLGVDKSSFAGGGTTIGSKAAFAEVKLIANVRYNMVQRICVLNHGANAIPIRVVTSTLLNTNFAQPSGLEPWLWRAYSSDGTDSGDISVAWSAEAKGITKSQLPNCSAPTSSNVKTSLRVPRTAGGTTGSQSAKSTEEKSFGVSASVKGLSISFKVTNGVSFRVTWFNRSKLYDRIVCVGAGSLGDFSTLPPNGLQAMPGTTSQVPLGMVIAVNTVAAP